MDNVDHTKAECSRPGRMHILYFFREIYASQCVLCQAGIPIRIYTYVYVREYVHILCVSCVYILYG